MHPIRLASLLPVVTPAALTCSSPVGSVLSLRLSPWLQRYSIFLSLFEVNELMDLIQGDFLSVNRTPLWVCLVFSCRRKLSSSGHTVRLCFRKQAKDAMLCLLSHVYCHSLCLSVCLSLPLPQTNTLMPPTVRSVYDGCPFLLNHNTIHWRALTRHLFTECEWITFQFCSTIKGVQAFKADTFYVVGKSMSHHNLPICHYKGRWHLNENENSYGFHILDKSFSLIKLIGCRADTMKVIIAVVVLHNL